MRDLKFGMYENLRDYSLGALLQRYKTELLILLTILLFLIGNELRVHHLVNKRTAELKGALEAKNAAEQEAVARTQTSLAYRTFRRHLADVKHHCA